MASRNRQEKIDELEAQLQEAEDIVTETREKLRHEQAKFERVARREMQRQDKHDYASLTEAFDRKRQSRSVPCPPLEFQKDPLITSDNENPYLNQRSEYPNCSTEPLIRNLYGPMPELPSIISRSKKHKVFRNACTQRIHACERNIVGNELSLSGQHDDASGKGMVEGAEKDINTCKSTFSEVHKVLNIESKKVAGKNDSISGGYEVQPMKSIPEEVKKATEYSKNTLCWLNKATETNVNDKEGDSEKLISKSETPFKTEAKYGKNKNTLGKKISDNMFMKGCKNHGVPHSDPIPKSDGDNPQPNEDPTANKPKLSFDTAGLETPLGCAKSAEIKDNGREGDTEKLISKGKPPVEIATKYQKNRSAIGKKIPDKMFENRHETFGARNSYPNPTSVQNNVQPKKDPKVTMPKLSPDIKGMETQLECAKTTETNNNGKQSGTEGLIPNGDPPVNISVPSVQEGVSADSSDIEVSNSNLKKVDEHILKSKLKINDATNTGFSLQLFKYTFQRKRKREIVSISDGAVLADNHTLERRKETKDTSEQSEKSSLAAYSGGSQ